MGHKIPDAREVSLQLLAERFGPVWDACKKNGVTFDLECHPSERAMGDLESASDYINFMCKAGYEGVVGFNLDGSHLEWQNVSVIEFIREFKDRIHCAHVKGVWVAREHCRAGRQPLVYRTQRESCRPDHTGRRGHRIQRRHHGRQ